MNLLNMFKEKVNLESVGVFTAFLVSIVLVVQVFSPVKAQTELFRQVDSQKEPEWVGPWYSYYLTQRPSNFNITLAPDKLYIPSAERWFWPEYSDNFRGIATLDASGNLGSLIDVYELDAATEDNQSQVVGMIDDFGGIRRAFDVLEINQQGWRSRLVSNFDFYPKFISAGRVKAQQLDDKIFAYVYDSLDRVYIAYDLSSEVWTKENFQDETDSFSKVYPSRNEDLKNLLTLAQSDKQFVEDLNSYLKQITDFSVPISVKQLLEDKILTHDQLLSAITSTGMDLVVSDEKGTLIPEVYGEEALLYASWQKKPRDLKMDVVPSVEVNNLRADIMIYTKIVDSDGQQKIITTLCQMAPAINGYMTPDCRGSFNFYPFRFSGTSMITLVQPSSVAGINRVGVIERMAGGGSRVVVGKYEISSAIGAIFERRETEYSTQSSITSMAILSLNANEYLLSMVENGELKIFFVRDNLTTPELTGFPVPVSRADNFEDISMRREGNVMIITATTQDNEIWEFKAAVPGTIWTP